MTRPDEPKQHVIHLDSGQTISGPNEDAVKAYAAASNAGYQRELERKKRWPGGPSENMAALAERFPTLQGAPGTRPWDAMQLLKWLCGPAPGEGALQAGVFCLSVWSSRTQWGDEALSAGYIKSPAKVSAAEERKLSPDDRAMRKDEQFWFERRTAQLNHFNVIDAWSTWDHEHQTAALSWLEVPFWP